jgi:DNA repair protein SbcC/Rad50
MFDRVLQAANLRLSLISYQRYSLVRELENSKNTGQRGLGINVDDTLTGKPRSASTLSGGETFMAALSLALSLSDIVQSLNGGIRIDTLFIDEGFGTLDDETLEETMKILQSLQNIGGQSRAIGLISHVEKVRNMVPNGFQIKKIVSGSHVEMRID